MAYHQRQVEPQDDAELAHKFLVYEYPGDSSSHRGEERWKHKGENMNKKSWIRYMNVYHMIVTVNYYCDCDGYYFDVS